LIRLALFQLVTHSVLDLFDLVLSICPRDEIIQFEVIPLGMLRQFHLQALREAGAKMFLYFRYESSMVRNRPQKDSDSAYVVGTGESRRVATFDERGWTFSSPIKCPQNSRDETAKIHLEGLA
jgi:hypothetical protein